VERGVAWHGLALNVGRDLAPFDLINPCGHAGVVSTSIALEQDWAAIARGERNLIGATAPDLQRVADLVAAAYQSELAAYGTSGSISVNSAVPAAAGGSR
jgi:lipoate-protein ligase B